MPLSSRPLGPSSPPRSLSTGRKATQSDRTPPHFAWTRQQWDIYLADALTKNRDVSTLPHSPIPMLRIHQISLRDLLPTVTPLNSWQWADNDNALPLGHLRFMLSYSPIGRTEATSGLNEELLRFGPSPT